MEKKFSLISLTIALLVGIGIGYLAFKYLFNPTNGKAIPLTLNKNAAELSGLSSVFPAQSVGYDSSKIAIDTLFYFAKNNPQTIISSMVASYGLDVKTIKTILGTAINNDSTNLRFYPALWPLGKGTNKFKYTLVIAGETKNGEMMFKEGDGPDAGTIFEYIFPCPPYCTDIMYKIQRDANGNPMLDPDGKPKYQPRLDSNGNPMVDASGKPLYVKNDFYTCQQWYDKLIYAGASPAVCPPTLKK